MTEDLLTPFEDNSTIPPNDTPVKTATIFVRDGNAKTAKQKNILSDTIQQEEVKALERLVKEVNANRQQFPNDRIVVSYPDYPNGPDPESSSEKSAWIPAETRQTLLDKLLNNVPLTIALSQLNILQFAFQYWKNRAEKSLIEAKNQLDLIKPQDIKYVDFIFSINSALETSKEILIRSIKMHGSRDWRANAWLLERRAPEFVKALPVQKVIVEDTRTQTHEVKSVNDDLAKYRSYLVNLDPIEDIEPKQLEA